MLLPVETTVAKFSQSQRGFVCNHFKLRMLFKVTALPGMVLHKDSSVEFTTTTTTTTMMMLHHFVLSNS